MFESFLTNIIIEMFLQIKGSKAMRRFKDEMGHANQCLITILLGLGEIKNQGVKFKKPESFSTTWAPQNVGATCDRSRIYAIKSSLSWAIDCLDMYITLCLRKVSIIRDAELTNKLNGAGQKVNAKFEALFDALGGEDDTILKYGAVVALAIQWRNNSIHYFATNEVEQRYIDIMQAEKVWYYDNCCALKIDEMYSRFQEGSTPTFKDMASIIRCIQKFVYKVDDLLLSRMDIINYIQEILREYYEAENTKAKLPLVPTLSINRQRTKLLNIVQKYFIIPVEKDGFELKDDVVVRLFRTLIEERRKDLS